MKLNQLASETCCKMLVWKPIHLWKCFFWLFYNFLENKNTWKRLVLCGRNESMCQTFSGCSTDRDTPPLVRKWRDFWWTLCGPEEARSCHHQVGHRMARSGNNTFVTLQRNIRNQNDWFWIHLKWLTYSGSEHWSLSLKSANRN